MVRSLQRPGALEPLRFTLDATLLPFIFKVSQHSFKRHGRARSLSFLISTICTVLRFQNENDAFCFCFHSLIIDNYYSRLVSGVKRKMFSNPQSALLSGVFLDRVFLLEAC